MKCYICNKESIGRFSPDMDLTGIPFCKKHKEKIHTAYIILMTEGLESFEKFIKRETQTKKEQ